MILSLMRFASFVWRHNPVEIKISEEYKSDVVKFGALGEKRLIPARKCTVIKGKGELVGADSLRVYEELSTLFKEKKTGVLTMPGLAPIVAQFSELTLDADSVPDVVRYGFTFTECDSRDGNNAKKEKYIASEGESLFGISHDEGVSLEVLVRLNPQIRYIDCLSDGDEVRLC